LVSVALWGIKALPLGWLHSELASVKRLTDLGILVTGSALWLLVAKWLLEKTGSALPRVVMRRLALR
jgi:hypothetical protein